MQIQHVSKWPLGLLFILLFFLNACVAATPTPQYAEDLRFSTIYTHDHKSELTSSAVLASSVELFDKALSDRQLKVTPIDFSSVSEVLDAIRDTERRSDSLSSSLRNGQFLVLGELSTDFYSALSGRYRWNVSVKLTLVDLVGRSKVSESFSIPAVLMYAHQNGDDAIASVSLEIQRRIGSLIDRYLKGRTVKPTLKSTVEPPPVNSSDRSPADSSEAPLVGGASPGDAIYFIMVDRFFNAKSDNDFGVKKSDPLAWHGGDLEGVRQKLGYLKALGINKIWLTPIFKTAAQNFFGYPAFHGYWTYDLNVIDAHFGNEKELEALALEAQSMGISLILDFVVNHVGYGSPLIEEKPAWFHPAKTIQDWNDVNELTTHQVHGLPDLNQNHPEVYDYLIQSARKWLKFPNIIGYRLDAVKHVGIDFWARFNSALGAEFPGLMLLGEYFDGMPAKVDEVQRDGKFTHMFDFPLAFALRNDFCGPKDGFDEMASVISYDRFYDKANQMVTFLDNHDMPRLASECQKTGRSIVPAIDMLLALRGIPSLYYGTEVPLYGSEEPHNRGDMQFTNLAYFEQIQKGLARRAQYPVFAYGETSIVSFDKDHMAIAREYGQAQAIIVYARQGASSASYRLPLGAWQSLPSNETVSGLQALTPGLVQFYVRDQAPQRIIDTRGRDISFKLSKGEASSELIVVGSTPELGMWNPSKGLKVKNDSKMTLSLANQSVILYKIVRQKADGTYEWRDGDNLSLYVDGAKEIEVSWNL